MIGFVETIFNNSMYVSYAVQKSKEYIFSFLFSLFVSLNRN